MQAPGVAGDYLQTSAIFDEAMRVLSLVTDPNDYAGPGTGYEPSPARQLEIDAIRQERGVDDLAKEQAAFRGAAARSRPAPGQDPRDVVIGVSPAVGLDVWRTLSGQPVDGVLGELLAGLEEEGCVGRLVRFNDTVDLGRIGLTAARLSGSGVGIGLQGKGTALIHRRDLPRSPISSCTRSPRLSRRSSTASSGRTPPGTPSGMTPDPARNPYRDEAIEARYHTNVIALMALERAWVRPGAAPEELSQKGLR